ncbi:hypothetical protein DESME_02825 [Desulfitobacterium metallireducens DSM 15288]|uniref:Uncharacterized protein n=1 Tax=Desulfitobacterium metallireducens DSM 15288 TaxID=871968 RepID=W0EC35_9FIRM|nr:hypothetical protein DESME_02825 [Desulfitobacterium metallireducens DSM 15288]
MMTESTPNMIQIHILISLLSSPYLTFYQKPLSNNKTSDYFYSPYAQDADLIQELKFPK